MGQVLNHIPIVFKYLQKFGDAITAYNDLKPFVERLDTQERSQLLKVLIQSDVWATTNDVAEKSTENKSLGPLGENVSFQCSNNLIVLLDRLLRLLTNLNEVVNAKFDHASYQCLQTAILACQRTPRV